MKIEAIFGGILALFVLAVAVYALVSTQIGGGPGGVIDPDYPTVPGGDLVSEEQAVCQCYNEAFRLAGSNVAVTSSQYRTGFEQCRALLGVAGSDAWTAGWNARLSSRPYEASCRSYTRRT